MVLSNQCYLGPEEQTQLFYQSKGREQHALDGSLNNQEMENTCPIRSLGRTIENSLNIENIAGRDALGMTGILSLRVHEKSTVYKSARLQGGEYHRDSE